MTASPANFSTIPPCVSMQREACSKKRDRRAGARPPDRVVGDERGRLDEVDEEDGRELALHAIETSGRRLLPRTLVPHGHSARRSAAASSWSSIPRVLDPKVFKAYDVRGLHGRELDEEGAYAIGRAYVEQFEPRADRGRPRHARLGAGDGARR